MKAKSEILQRAKILEEDELRERLLEHPFYRKEIAQFFEDGPVGAKEPDNYAVIVQQQLRNGTELTRTSYSALFELLDDACKRLSLPVEARLFKANLAGESENAWVAGAHGRIIIGFQSGILTTLGARAEVTQSIIGHELGHFGFGHEGNGLHGIYQEAQSLYDVRRRSKEQDWLVKQVDSKPFREVLLLASLLSQVKELNADRAGLLVQPDLSASIEAEMLLVAGAADAYGQYHSRDYLTQARELVRSPDPFDASDLETTHPGGPFRALALEFFSETDVFRELTGQGSGRQKASELTRLLPRLIPLQALRPSMSGYGRIAKQLPAFLDAPALETAIRAEASKVVAPSSPSSAVVASPPPPRVPPAPLRVPPPPPPLGRTAPPNGAPQPLTSAPSDESDDGVEWLDAVDVVFDEEDSVMSARDRAELGWVLAVRIIASDGKVTKGEDAFLGSLIRPRALADEIFASLIDLPNDVLQARGDALIERARTLHGRTKRTLIKTMIQAAKADRKVDDDELRGIRHLAQQLDASATAERELRNVFGSRIDSL